MTRDEFEEALTQARRFGGSGLDPFFKSFLAHDQAQRAVIDGLSKKIKQLTAWSDKMFGTPCEEIRHQQIVDGLQEKIEQQAKEIAELKTIIQACNKDNLTDAVMRAVIENKTLREALQGILEIGKRDMSNPKYDGYFEQAQQALKEVS